MIRTLIARRATHDDEVLRVFCVLAVNELHSLVVDDARIGVIDGTVTTDEHLGRLHIGCLLRHQLAEARVRVDHVRDTLRGVEPGNLDDVIAQGPAELRHLLLDAERAELAHVVLTVPVAELLVEAVEPVGGGGEQRDPLDGDILGHEGLDGVAWLAVSTWRCARDEGY